MSIWGQSGQACQFGGSPDKHVNLGAVRTSMPIWGQSGQACQFGGSPDKHANLGAVRTSMSIWGQSGQACQFGGNSRVQLHKSMAALYFGRTGVQHVDIFILDEDSRWILSLLVALNDLCTTVNRGIVVLGL